MCECEPWPANEFANEFRSLPDARLVETVNDKLSTTRKRDIVSTLALVVDESVINSQPKKLLS